MDAGIGARVLAVALALAAGGPALAAPGADVLSAADGAGRAPTRGGPKVASAPGAVLRGLDKVSGALTDIRIAAGGTQRFGQLEITLGDCRYPVSDPASNAFAWLTIDDLVAGKQVFAGWMVANSPALDPLDHPRYDVWVLRCSRVSASGS